MIYNHLSFSALKNSLLAVVGRHLRHVVGANIGIGNTLVGGTHPEYFLGLGRTFEVEAPQRYLGNLVAGIACEGRGRSELELVGNQG